MPVREELGARADRRENDQVAVLRIDPSPGSDRLLDEDRGPGGGGFLALFILLRLLGRRFGFFGRPR